MLRRKAREELEKKRDLMAAALWANSNYDNPEVDRAEIIQRVEESYADVIRMLYEGAPEKTDDAGLIEPGNPFFDAMRRGLHETRAPGEAEIIAEKRKPVMSPDEDDAFLRRFTERDE